jgi:hypothetical protein
LHHLYVGSHLFVENSSKLFVLIALKNHKANGRSLLHDEANQRRPLGEQAVFLKTVRDRLTALRRALTTMQITLARAIVLRALYLLAIRYCDEMFFEFFVLFVESVNLAVSAAV